MVTHALRNRVAMFRNMNTILQEQKDTEDSTIRNRLREIKMEIETIKARRIHLYENYAGGMISKECYLSDKQKMTERIGELEKEQEALISSAEEEDALLSGVKRIADDSDEINGKRELSIQMAESYIDKVVIYDPKHMEIVFTFEDLLQQAADRVNSISGQEGQGASA